MKVTSKRQGRHNLPCLEGLLQTPLISNDTIGERLTQISAHSLDPVTSRTIHHQPPPITPRSSTSFDLSTTVFFPPLPPRSTQNRSHILLNNHSTKVEFNVEHAKIRDAQSPKTRFDGSALNFPSSPTDSNVIANNNWPQQPLTDDNYHLYHEPIDMFEQQELKQNDVPADVYFSYVSLKSNEQSNHRSSSYHGPKNTDTASMNRHLSAVDMPAPSSTSVTSLPISPTMVRSSEVPIHFRDLCVKELIQTELNYVNALDMIITRFAKPMELLLRRDENQLIFGHIKEFYNIHRKFQANLVKAANRIDSNKDLSKNLQSTKNQTLKQIDSPSSCSRSSPLSSPTCDTDGVVSSRVNKDNPMKISSCFLKVRSKFLKYGEYCSTLAKAQSLIDDLTSRNEAIASQLDRCQQEANDGRFKLRDLLSLPMQRILKYHLLLSHLIKNTNSDDDDYQGLKQAYESMVDLCEYINEVARDTEALQIINSIESSIIGLNMPPNTRLIDYGRLVIDDLIRLKTPSDNKQKVTNDSRLKLPLKSKPKMYVFVFDKVVLITNRYRINSNTRYDYKEALVLTEYKLEVNSEAQPVETLGKWSFHFDLVKISDKTTYTFYMKTQEMKNKWILSIKRAMDNTRPVACRKGDNNHEFLMHTFEKASSCDYCGKLLHGLFYQGYRCRVCSTSVHKKCLEHSGSCAPALPPKLVSSLSNRRGRCNELPSPSVRSHCSEEDAFFNQPSSISSSTQGVDATLVNEYSNIVGSNNMSSPFGEHPLAASSTRPVASMINVSVQNSTNHLTHQRDLLCSASDDNMSHDDGAKDLSTIDNSVNFILYDLPWFCGRMERERAQALLEDKSHETFLVRVSLKHNGSYVISLNYNAQVKHMRIYVSQDGTQFYLSQNRYFRSVIELVNWYGQNSLVESFHMLDARLLIPFKGT